MAGKERTFVGELQNADGLFCKSSTLTCGHQAENIPALQRCIDDLSLMWPADQAH